ncbi:MAG: pectate lyase [Verrucomicrobia bacterium]|nr:pectate lyase [Verrucomicrobiota bacterium]
MKQLRPSALVGVERVDLNALLDSRTHEARWGQRAPPRSAGWLACALFLVALSAVAADRAFPGAEGWAAFTPGGRGGKILRVTTLAPSGPGSFIEAIKAKGPRIVVFEVGGVVDLSSQKAVINEPFLTIAGQTAPSPGITLIKQELQVATHDVVIRHIRMRTGEAGHAKKSGWEADGLSTLSGASNVIVDHCSFAWATDENLSVSGKAFLGANAAEWRRNTSHTITYSHNIVAEGLSHSTHTSGEHSKGTLVMDNSTEVLLLRNLYANNSQRHPLAKGGTWVGIVNNVIYNPAIQAIGYRLPDVLWHNRKFENGKLDIVGNVMRHGPNTQKDLSLLVIEGIGDVDVRLADNINLGRDGRPLRIAGANPAAKGRIVEHDAPVFWPEGLVALPAAQVEEFVFKNAGARPWDRDAVDERIVRETRARTGRIIDSEQEVGGYPTAKETRQPFNPAEWDLRTMERR